MCARCPSIGLGILVILGLPTSSTLAGQSSSTTQIIDRFLAAADQYRSAFQSLVAEETKTIDVFKAAGTLGKRRQIVSDLVVYSSRGAETTEYRDVREVNGKAVNRRGDRAMKLLTAAMKADSLEKELRGLTIGLGVPFSVARDLFDIEWSGRESIDGHEVAVLRYRQTVPIPGAQTFSLPGFPAQSTLQQGQLWLDAETGRLWRAENEYTVRHPLADAPIVTVRMEKAYASSQFGILVPQRFVFSTFTRVHHPKNGHPTLGLHERTTFTYGSFKRFAVSSDEIYATPAKPQVIR